MLILNRFLIDQSVWDVVRELYLPLVAPLIVCGIMIAIALYLTQPNRAKHYDENNFDIRHFIRLDTITAFIRREKRAEGGSEGHSGTNSAGHRAGEGRGSDTSADPNISPNAESA